MPKCYTVLRDWSDGSRTVEKLIFNDHGILLGGGYDRLRGGQRGWTDVGEEMVGWNDDHNGWAHFVLTLNAEKPAASSTSESPPVGKQNRPGKLTRIRIKVIYDLLLVRISNNDGAAALRHDFDQFFKERQRKRQAEELASLAAAIQEVYERLAPARTLVLQYGEAITRWRREQIRLALTQYLDENAPIADQLRGALSAYEDHPANKRMQPASQQDLVRTATTLIEDIAGILRSIEEWSDDRDSAYNELLGIAEVFLTAEDPSAVPISLLDRANDLEQKLNMPHAGLESAIYSIERVIRTRAAEQVEAREEQLNIDRERRHRQLLEAQWSIARSQEKAAAELSELPQRTADAIDAKAREAIHDIGFGALIGGIIAGRPGAVVGGFLGGSKKKQ